MKLKSIDSGRLQVVYEDDDVININKTIRGCFPRTANEYILSYLRRVQKHLNHPSKRPTSGLLKKTLKDFDKRKSVQKYYRSL